METLKPFWRDEPLSGGEQCLLEAVLAAHRASAFRDNLSTGALKLAAAGSGSYCNAVIAALATLGKVHGPIEETYDFVADLGSLGPQWELLTNARVPGWGNSFVKGQKDPLWLEVDESLRAVAPITHARLEQVTQILHRRGKQIFPNPSAYTAAAALVLGIPRQLAPWIFVSGRLTGWTELLAGKGES